jgi:hypothetical protein
LIVRRRYRKEFGLTTAEYYDEPLSEINLVVAIWKLEAKRQKKDNKAIERKTPQNGKHN